MEEKKKKKQQKKKKKIISILNDTINVSKKFQLTEILSHLPDQHLDQAKQTKHTKSKSSPA